MTVLHREIIKTFLQTSPALLRSENCCQHCGTARGGFGLKNTNNWSAYDLRIQWYAFIWRNQ